jgi:hypothetical protein
LENYEDCGAEIASSEIPFAQDSPWEYCHNVRKCVSIALPGLKSTKYSGAHVSPHSHRRGLRTVSAIRLLGAGEKSGIAGHRRSLERTGSD